jgi:monoamine oxidase
MNNENHKKVDVVIIGAGASGLQCASDLLSSKAPSTFSGSSAPNNEKPSLMILEARDRVGGRILSSTATAVELAKNSQVSFSRDLGAAWVHGTGLSTGDKEDRNPMMRLLEQTTPEGKTVEEFHLSPAFAGNGWMRPDTILHKADRIALFRNGTLIENDSNATVDAIKRHYRIQKEIAEHAKHLYEIGEGIQTVNTSVAQVRSMISANIATNDDDDDASSLFSDLVPFYAFLSENWNGLPDNDIQLSFIGLPETPMQTDELYVDEGDYEGPHCKLKHGMEAVVKPLYDQVADHIHLNEQVTRISRLGNQQLRIETSSGLTVDTKCCISTIPLGCLQKHATSLFDPPLSADAMDSIHSIATGFYKKVFLTFDSIFWPTNEPLLGLVRSADRADELGQYLLLYNFYAKDSIPCLEAVLCGNSGKWAVSRSDAEIRHAVLKFVEDSLGAKDVESKCVSCHVTRWEEDPFTLGTYSSFCLGTLERHVDTLKESQWDGDLVFAGEFTESDHMGSVQAALISGERAAAQVLETLSRKELVLQSTERGEMPSNVDPTEVSDNASKKNDAVLR